MTFDSMSVEVTCVTLPKDHCVQVPWKYINVCGYSDQFCKIPHTYTYIHTHTYYIQNEWSHSLLLNSVQVRQLLNSVQARQKSILSRLYKVQTKLCWCHWFSCIKTLFNFKKSIEKYSFTDTWCIGYPMTTKGLRTGPKPAVKHDWKAYEYGRECIFDLHANYGCILLFIFRRVISKNLNTSNYAPQLMMTLCYMAVKVILYL